MLNKLTHSMALFQFRFLIAPTTTRPSTHRFQIPHVHPRLLTLFFGSYPNTFVLCSSRGQGRRPDLHDVRHLVRGRTSDCVHRREFRSLLVVENCHGFTSNCTAVEVLLPSPLRGIWARLYSYWNGVWPWYGVYSIGGSWRYLAIMWTPEYVVMEAAKMNACTYKSIRSWCSFAMNEIRLYV